QNLIGIPRRANTIQSLAQSSGWQTQPTFGKSLPAFILNPTGSKQVLIHLLAFFHLLFRKRKWLEPSGRKGRQTNRKYQYRKQQPPIKTAAALIKAKITFKNR
ncbi:hypothetical protein ABMA58_13785, partial [Oceanospirillum sp. HFRX-1_2]